MHPTYKHLEDRIRIGGLSLGQWAQLLVCGLAAYVLSTVLPFPGSWSISVAVTLCGLPAAGAVAFMSADFDVPALGRAAVRWRLGQTLYAATAPLKSAADDEVFPTSGGTPRFDALSLWD